MSEKRKKRFARAVALILAIGMLLMTGFYIFAMTGWFGDAANAQGIFVRAASSNASSSNSVIHTKMSDLETLLLEIKDSYKDEINVDKVFDGIYEGLFDSLEDPWSVYYSSSDTANKLVQSIEGEYSGVGITMTASNGRVVVTSVVKASPAELAGIRPGDYIVKIDGVNIEGMDIDEVALRIRGEAGSSVTLTLEQVGILKTLTMIRKTIKTQSVLYEMLDNQIGYIQITGFDSNTDEEFFEARLTLLSQGMKGLVIDIRNNGGGLMHSALSIADQLIPTAGNLAHYEKQGRIIDTVSSSGNNIKVVPMVVLTNSNTASASECLVGALKDRGVATVVGETTYGKGVAQIVSEIPGGTAIKLSVFYFLTPNKTRIDGVGVTPDIIVHLGGGLSKEEIAKLNETLVPMSENIKYYAGGIGLNVYAAQQRLKELNYDVDLTARMDSKMIAAVKKFQAENKLFPYGGLDFTTIKTVGSVFSSYINPTTEDLQLKKALEILKK